MHRAAVAALMLGTAAISSKRADAGVPVRAQLPGGPDEPETGVPAGLGRAATGPPLEPLPVATDSR